MNASRITKSVISLTKSDIIRSIKLAFPDNIDIQALDEHGDSKMEDVNKNTLGLVILSHERNTSLGRALVSA